MKGRGCICEQGRKLRYGTLDEMREHGSSCTQAPIKVKEREIEVSFLDCLPKGSSRSQVVVNRVIVFIVRTSTSLHQEEKSCRVACLRRSIASSIEPSNEQQVAMGTVASRTEGYRHNLCSAQRIRLVVQYGFAEVTQHRARKWYRDEPMIVI